MLLGVLTYRIYAKLKARSHCFRRMIDKVNIVPQVLIVSRSCTKKLSIFFNRKESAVDYDETAPLVSTQSLPPVIENDMP